jgi:hypothetical protein
MWITIILLIIALLFIGKDFIFTQIIEYSDDIKKYIFLLKNNINIKILLIICVLLYFIYDVKYYYKILIIFLVIIGITYHKNINYIMNQLWKLKSGDIFINHFNII